MGRKQRDRERIESMARFADLDSDQVKQIVKAATYLTVPADWSLIVESTAADKAYQKIFYVKLAFIVLALVTLSRIRRTVFGDPAALAGAIPSNAKALAIASLLLWVGAIVAGRLMAYTTTF